MAITNICSTVTLGSEWHEVSLGTNNSFYIVGIREAKGPTDTIDPMDVKRVVFEVGIDCGLSTPLTISHITLNFDDYTSNDKAVNAITALTRQLNYPESFKLRPNQIWTVNGLCSSNASTSISVNIVPMKFNQ